MNLIIHRGTHEIGGTCVEIATDETRIIIDLGMPLSDPREPQKKLRDFTIKGKTVPELIDMKILPRVPGLYRSLGEERPMVDALLLSHPHPDHYGLIKYVREDIPLYMGKDTDLMLKAAEVFQGDRIGRHDKTVHLSDRVPTDIKDIKITPYIVDHSAYGAMAFLVEADGKKVFYSGDFRGHGRKASLFEKLVADPPADVNVLLMEGTLMGRQNETAQTEAELETAIVQEATAREGMKLFVCSGQNVDRLVTFYHAALKLKVPFVLDLYGANVLHELHRESLPVPTNGHRFAHVLFTQYFMDRLKHKNLQDWIARFRSWAVTPTELRRMAKKAFVMYRNSSVHEFEKAGVPKGSVLFYSMWSQYSLEPNFEKTRAFMDRHGIQKIDMHTSGHAILADLKRFAAAMDPEVIVPIHTERPEDYRAHFGNKVHCLKDGEVLVL